MIVIEYKKDSIELRKASKRDLIEAAYILLMLIPLGKVTTYKSLARILGLHPRAIAKFMALNKNPIIIPCHRVIMSNGEIGGYSLGGSVIKEKLLKIEGVKVNNGKVAKENIIEASDIIDP